MKKVRLWCCTHDAQSMEEEIIEVEEKTTKEQLEQIAEDFYQNCKEPEWGFEILDEE